MNLAFLFGACVLVLLALGFLLWPLLRRTTAQPPQALLAIALSVGLPLLALGLYGLIGTPAALRSAANAQPATQVMAMDQAIAKLRTHLAEQPDDVQGWALLGNAYRAMQQPAAASSAYERALALEPNNPDLLVAAAEAASMARDDHVIGDTGRARLQRALDVSPDNQRALWLLGISEFQAGNFVAAQDAWETLLPLLDPASQQSVIASVREQIANAAARSGESAGATGPIATKAAAKVRIEVRVELAPELVGKVPDGASLFVFARAVDGPPVPLAVARLPAVLPVETSLDDSMAMTPQARLSMHQQVTVQARISASGNALPQAGDLESKALPVSLDEAGAQATLTIDHILQDQQGNAKRAGSEQAVSR